MTHPLTAYPRDRRASPPGRVRPMRAIATGIAIAALTLLWIGVRL